jgi:hypothetical protein
VIVRLGVVVREPCPVLIAIQVEHVWIAIGIGIVWCAIRGTADAIRPYWRHGKKAVGCILRVIENQRAHHTK